MNKKLLLIMSKNPIAGTVKTRLAATIGNKQALDIYNILLERTAQIAQQCAAKVRVCYSPQILHQDVFEDRVDSKVLQSAGDLGERMAAAFNQAFTDGYKQVCIIGCDCYDLDAKTLNQAFEALNKHDAVIGPSEDGGYYLLGLNSPLDSLFVNKQWSTSSVFEDSCKDFETAERSYYSLPVLNDIDEYDDLPLVLRQQIVVT